MSAADIVTKNYMRNNAVFADAFNYLLYNGEQVISPDDLHELDSTELAALAAGLAEYSGKKAPKNSIDTVQKYRDVLKSAVIMQNNDISYVIFGVENQTDVHYAMPVRNMIYDGLQYGRQIADITAAHMNSDEKFKGRSKAEFLSGFCKDDLLKPVITLVIHFGTDEWDGPMSLHDMIDSDDAELLKFVPDHRINLIDPSRLSEKELLKFSTSLREVLLYIKYSKDKKKLLEITDNNPRMLLDVSAAQVINTVTNTSIKISDKTEVVDMCQAIKEIMEDCKTEGKISTLSSLIHDGILSVSEAAARADMSIDDFNAAVDRLSHSA